jgi:ParB/RepB/Spo0J family partition protein
MAAGGPVRLPETRPTLRQVPLEQIVSESDLQGRAPFNPHDDAEDAELVESVREVGVRVPVHLQDQGDGTYRIRSGHRRVSAARLAGLGRIQAIAWPPEADAFDSALDTWLENLHRKDLSPHEKGRMLLLLMDRFNLPRSPETASRLGLSKTSYYRYLGLTEAPADVREALDAGVVGLAQAEKIAAIEPPEVRGSLIQAAKDGVPASRIEEAIDSHRAGEAIPAEVLKPHLLARRQEPRGGGQASAQTWSRGKVRELSQLLGLKTSELDAIAKALKARRITSPQATAAALLVSAGQPATQALADVAAVDRRTLSAVEMLFKAVYRPSPRTGRSGALVALHRILTVLERELESRSVSGSGN